MRSSDIQRELGVKLLILRVKRRQLRRFQRRIRMLPGPGLQLARGIMYHPEQERLRIRQEERESAAGERDVWNALLSLHAWRHDP